MGLLVFCTPEDAVVKTEHIEGDHGRIINAYTILLVHPCHVKRTFQLEALHVRIISVYDCIPSVLRVLFITIFGYTAFWPVFLASLFSCIRY